MDILICTGISLDKKQRSLLHDITFSVQEGEFVGITGPSGSGKTSLLKIINHLDSPSAGTVTYDGKDVAACDPMRLRREIGYVHQKPFLFEDTVRDNLEYPFHVWKQKPDQAAIAASVEKVNLPLSILDKRITGLSGGEQQRIALIRSLLARPRILLLDEITSSLDEDNSLTIEHLLRDENQRHKTTVLFISHNKQQILRLGQKLLYIDQGRMRYFGPPADFYKASEA